MSSETGVPSLRRVEAIFSNPALYALAERIPKRGSLGGRPRTYPDYMLLGFEALVSVYGSARQVEAELSHPLVWSVIRRIVRERFPDRAELHLPESPMRRHHYLYGRDRYLIDPEVFAQMQDLHRSLAAAQARELGLLDPDGPGSWTHPDLSRMLHADGKVLTPLYRAKPGERMIDRSTGEIRPLRAEADAGLHFEGGGEAAWGTKFVLVAVRSSEERGRIILDLEWVPDPGGEAAGAMRCFRRLSPLVPGAHGVLYDTALRGAHHQVLLRELGLMGVNRVAPKEAARFQRGARVIPKTPHVEDKVLRRSDGTAVTIRLYARGGAIGIGELTETGDIAFVELPRIRTHRSRGKDGTYRWYNDYALPASYGGGAVTVRLHGNNDDAIRRFNRTENVRAIAPSDPDFARLYARRNDAESINRGLEDSMWLGRAHSLGHARQALNLLGYALMVNSLALLEHRERRRALRPAA